MKILGISLGHDTNFTLLEDGEIVEVREAERFYRKKRYKLQCDNLEDVPVDAGFQYINSKELREFLIKIREDWGDNYDLIAVQNQQRAEEFSNLKRMLLQEKFFFGDIQNLNHHLCHASSAFFTSPFPSSLILSYDGAGNDGNTVLLAGDGNSLDYIQSLTVKFGNAYNNLGFIANLSADVSGSTAGKAMGLTSYGDHISKWEPILKNHILTYEKKSPKIVDGLKDYGRAHNINWDHIFSIPEISANIDADASSRFKNTDKTLHDFLQTAQGAWTACVLELLENFSESHNNLCIVGGCALNGITNYAIQESGLFENTHFIPNPSDCGLSMGAALYAYHCICDNLFEGRKKYLNPYLGEEIFDKDSLPMLRSKYRHRKIPQTERALARLIAAGKIVGIVRGRYEIGPRALGNRSILCNSQDPKMREVLNDKVKHREWYRPFAPVCTAEDSSKYFSNSSEIPYMSVICYTLDSHKEKLPAVTHVDGSSRLQTVSSSQHPFLHSVLKHVEKHTGYPIVLNTSFNPGGEPILNYYEVALKMLESTDLDYVLIEDEFFWA